MVKCVKWGRPAFAHFAQFHFEKCVILGTSPRCTEKKFYRDVFGDDIDISDISLAVELLGHVYPQLILDKANLSEKVKNANVVDAGTISVDNNRKVWDKISGKMSIDEYMDIFMK